MTVGSSPLLFDFFGTLVDYSPSRTEQGYPLTYELLRRHGVGLTYEQFLDCWSAVFAGCDRASGTDDREFSMTDVAAAFLRRTLAVDPDAEAVSALAETYVDEWAKGVRYLPGVPELVRQLAAHHRLAVVTNTHHRPLVPDHLAAMGVSDAFVTVVTSVEVGWRKPHPAIYAAALAALGADPAGAIFVGDSYGPDFLGPERAGMTAYLIDPYGRAALPPGRRLDTIFDLPARLGPAGSGSRR